MPRWDAFPSEWETLDLDSVQCEHVVYAAAPWTSHLSALRVCFFFKDSAEQEVSCQPNSCLNGMLTARLQSVVVS